MDIVSVIVPVYNVEKFLPMCVDSILAQTYTEFELILVDDGSLDNCSAICDDYAAKDSRIKVIHEENCGVSAARNSALEITSGKYVVFCDSDDYYDSDWLDMLVSTLENSDADIAVGNYTRITEEGNIVRGSMHEVGNYLIQTWAQKKQYFIDLIFGGGHGWEVWTRIFCADIIRAHQIRFCESCGNFAEDMGFVLEYMLYANEVVSVENSGYNYRTRTESMMSKSKGVAKLNEVNEVSLHFAASFHKAFSKREAQNALPIFHFLIMNNQYRKIVGTEKYAVLKQELETIRRYNEWRKMTKGIFRCYQDLIGYFGKTNAQKIVLLSHYCLHGNWRRFTIESAIAYKWLIKG